MIGKVLRKIERGWFKLAKKVMEREEDEEVIRDIERAFEESNKTPGEWLGLWVIMVLLFLWLVVMSWIFAGNLLKFLWVLFVKFTHFIDDVSVKMLKGAIEFHRKYLK